MKQKRLTAALLAAAMIPAAAGILTALPAMTVSAEESAGLPASLPEWVPVDFESALKFRNTCGATHIENGLICVVFKEEADRTPEGEPRGVLRYQLDVTPDLAKCLKNEVYSTKEGASAYQVLVFDPQKTGDLEIKLTDTWRSMFPDDPEPEKYYFSSTYSFHIAEDDTVTETDRFGWVPDCLTEYNAFKEYNGAVSVKDNYVIFCLDEGIGTAYSWKSSINGPEGSNEPEGQFTYYALSDCSRENAVPVDGGTAHYMEIYQATADGYAKIEYTYGPYQTTGETEQTLTADCVILDDAQTVLLSNSRIFRFVDYETGELLPFPDEEHPFQITTYLVTRKVVDYIEDEDDPYYIFDNEYEKLTLNVTSNPYILQFPVTSETIIYECIYTTLLESSLPEEYTQFCPNSGGITKGYGNYAHDVTYSIKRLNPDKANGDLNGDDRFSIADAVTLQKWLLSEQPDALANWKDADFSKDGQLSAVDLTLMLRALLQFRSAASQNTLRFTAAYANLGTFTSYSACHDSYQEDAPEIVELLEKINGKIFKLRDKKLTLLDIPSKNTSDTLYTSDLYLPYINEAGKERDLLLLTRGENCYYLDDPDVKALLVMLIENGKLDGDLPVELFK